MSECIGIAWVHGVDACPTLYSCLRSIICISNAKQKQPEAVKKGTSKQSRIKNIVWYLRWLVRTRADISLRPSGLVKPRTDIKLQPIGLVRSDKD